MNISVKGKTIVITGASRGIGKFLAYKFAKEQANVIVNFKNSTDAANNFIKELNSFNKNCIAIQADVSDQTDVKKLRDKVIKRFGSIDTLINNAGVSTANPIPIMKIEEWEEVIDTNLKSVFLTSRIFGIEMIKKQRGKIINISSLLGQTGKESLSNYSASKAGVIGFTKSMAKEMAKFNICVNAICPGFIATDLNKCTKEMKSSKENIQKMEELANFIIYLSSDYCNHINGQIFNVDSRIT
ncbi:MAG: 3-oxoacyl-ACP reductase FabG [Endomicrobia bacterium]|nr:3-oxoacyl-ACP reductase FabG [Endomicrobiia bacterium]